MLPAKWYTCEIESWYIIQLVHTDNPALLDLLDLGDYKFKPERMMVFNIEAYDWNCPQHITPRYTVEEIENALAPQKAYVAKLETTLKELKIQLKESQGIVE